MFPWKSAGHAAERKKTAAAQALSREKARLKRDARLRRALAGLSAGTEAEQRNAQLGPNARYFTLSKEEEARIPSSNPSHVRQWHPLAAASASAPRNQS